MAAETQPLAGIHHVTALATDPRANVDFYTRVLGLRLVKKTVNFDDPGTYHLYFGDRVGSPGTILTFFPWPRARRGSRGVGQVTVTSLAVPEGSLDWWRQRFERYGVVQEDPHRRLDEEVLTFFDPDGLKLELVADEDAEDHPSWSEGPVAAERAVRGFHGVTLMERSLEPTAGLLTEGMGLRRVAEEGGRVRFASRAEGLGTWVDVLPTPDAPDGRDAAGTVHHVAFRVSDDEDQRAWREELESRGLELTPVLDRQYFHSVYFREPGGVLFELATDPPGFTLDEPVAKLGTGLRLPSWLEPHRERIEQVLPDLEDPGSGGPDWTQN